MDSTLLSTAINRLPRLETNYQRCVNWENNLSCPFPSEDGGAAQVSSFPFESGFRAVKIGRISPYDFSCLRVVVPRHHQTREWRFLLSIYFP